MTAVHDVSDGGILVAVTEMALASDIGARLTVESFEDHVDREKVQHAWSLFGETKGDTSSPNRTTSTWSSASRIDADVCCCFHRLDRR